MNAELPQEIAKRRIDAMLAVEKGKRENGRSAEKNHRARRLVLSTD